MVEYTIVPTKPEHIRPLVMAAREEDAAEANALGIALKTGVWRSYRRSVMTRTVFVEGEIAAMWGLYCNLLSDEGTPWMVTTPLVELGPLAYLREAKKAVREMLEIKPRLSNIVPVSYKRAVRFFQLVGFNVSDPEPFGPDGVLFHTLSMEK